MIRKLFIALICAGSLAAAQEYAPAPAHHDGCPMPGHRKPSRFTLDVNLLYGFNAAPDSTYSADMAGLEIGGAYYITPRQAFTLSFLLAADTQTEDHDDYHHHHHFVDDPYDRSDLSLMAGYRFTQPIGRYVSFTAGAKGGLDIQRLSVKSLYIDPNGWYDEYRTSGTRCGFGYAGYAELGVLITPRARFTVGYQYHGATTKPVAKDHVFGERFSAKDMRWHEVRVGIDVSF